MRVSPSFFSCLFVLRLHRADIQSERKRQRDEGEHNRDYITEMGGKDVCCPQALTVRPAKSDTHISVGYCSTLGGK